MKNLRSRKQPKVEEIEVLIPMHLDNWALSLASGYVGPGLKADRAIDLQSPYSKSLLGFIGSVPQSALTIGDNGPRVVLKCKLRPEQIVASGGGCFIPGLLRVTRIDSVHFSSEEELKNFNASYGIFPDVPTALLPRVVGQYEVSLLEDSMPDEPIEIETPPDRRKHDYFGGWAGGLVEVLAGRKFDKEVQAHLRTASTEENSPFTASCSLLKAFHPDASIDDEIIWGTVVEVISEKGELRGFDQSTLLEEVAARSLKRVTGDASGVQSWIDTCSKIIRATIDPPVLDDRKRIGQRAALGALLAPDFLGASSLNATLEAGPRVRTLCMVVARAFEGLSRLGAEHKNQISRLEGILDISDVLQRGKSVVLQIGPRRFDMPGRVVDHLMLEGRELLARELEMTRYEAEVLRVLSTKGFEFGVGEEDGSLYMKIDRQSDFVVWLQEDTSGTGDDINVRLVLPLVSVKGKITTKQMQPYLETAWSEGCSIGIREHREGKQMCAFAVVKLSDLTLSSVSSHLSRLTRSREMLAQNSRGKGKGRARSVKSALKASEATDSNDRTQVEENLIP